MADLLRCPFCGCSVYAIQDTTLLCGHRYWYIRHKNSDCILGDNFRSQFYTTREKLIFAWNNTRTADVAEVVRCKDCDVPHNKWLGCPHLNGLIPPPDFYCAKGTPKERR